MKSCTKSITLVLCAVACLTSGRAAFGQNAQGTILGHVTDPSGAPVTAAEVALTNIDRNVSQVTHTSDVGDYVFVDVQPGNYTLKLTAAGFKTAQATGLKLGVDQTLRQNFDLAIGTLNEQVSVQADAQMVQTDNTTVGTTFNQELISELPISGRDISNLLRVQAGASIMGGGPAWAWTMHGLNTDYLETSINGARPESISYLIDGITNNDQFFASPSNLPSSFAVSEFKSQNGLYSAEYGQGSAQVNIAIRQGTNDYHGNAYDFLQNDFFQPESPLNKFLNQENPSPTPLPLKNTLKQNQFGFTLGGPLVIPKLYNGRNKSFFFFSADWGIIRQAQPSSITVPTQQERTGNFSDWPYPIYDPSTTVVNSDGSITRTPFPGNIIPSSEISPIANSILKYVPVPNSTCANPCSSGGNYRISVPKPWDTHAYSMRGDQLLSEKDRLFFTGVIGQQSFINTSIMPLSGEVKYTWDDLFGLNWQHTFTPTIFNEARFGYNRLHFEDSSATSNGPNIAAQLGFANTPNLPEFYGPPIISWSGYQTLGNGNSGWFQNNHIYEWVDNLKIVTGRHTFTMGVDLRRLQLDLIDGYGVEGSLGFNGAFTALDPSAAGSPGPTAGNSFADFLLGQVQNASHPANVGADKYDVRGMNWNFFVQDDLRITPKLTLNLGLRYEIPPAFRSLDKSGVGLDQSNGGGFIWANSSFVQQVSSQPGVNQNLIRCCAPTSLVPQDWHDFAPRIGFAWRPFDSDRFVIRPAYGIFYDIYSRYYELTTYDEDYLYTAPSFSYPNIPGNSKTSPVQLDGLWSPLTNAQNYGYFQLPGWQANGQINYPGNKSPRTQQWSLDTQFALNQNTILDVGYIGSRASHENGYWYFNAGYLPTVPGDVCNTLRSVQEAQQSSPGCLT
ncbi:MAG: TonB-dependent receptor, partial [Acidobacteriaceae bacterium]|nr:TonB-dependent receptor [Acidobacteriaceae bacterium]